MTMLVQIENIPPNHQYLQCFTQVGAKMKTPSVIEKVKMIENEA